MRKSVAWSEKRLSTYYNADKPTGSRPWACRFGSSLLAPVGQRTRLREETGHLGGADGQRVPRLVVVHQHLDLQLRLVVAQLLVLLGGSREADEPGCLEMAQYTYQFVHAVLIQAELLVQARREDPLPV